MNDALTVGSFKRFGDLFGDDKRLIHRDGTTRHPLVEAFTIDEFKDEELLAVRFLQPVDRADVRMIERSEDLRLTTEAHQTLGLVCERVRQSLQRNIATELCVSRAIDLAHAALPEERHDFVGAEATARSQGHVAGVGDYIEDTL
jgi:hypothetical protein